MNVRHPIPSTLFEKDFLADFLNDACCEDRKRFFL
jgi:hypothetical protein